MNPIAKRAVVFDVYCDSAGCVTSARLKIEETQEHVLVSVGFVGEGEECQERWQVTSEVDISVALPPGWGRLAFCGRGNEVMLDFCPEHLSSIVVPWVGALAVLEADVPVGKPVEQADLSALPKPPVPVAIDEDEDDSWAEWPGGLVSGVAF